MNSRRGFLRDLAAAAAQVGSAAREATAEPVAPASFPLSDAELDRYGRQLALPEWGLAQQAALREARVLVVGTGALGSPVALYLAGAGVGRLGILDDDAVELSNLHRQLLHFTPDVGVPKAASAAAKLRFLNPDIVIEPYQVRLEPANAGALVEGQDLVVDCSDAFATRYAVNAACCAARVPLVEAGVSGFTGLVMSVRPGETACYRCAFPAEPADAPASAQPGASAGSGRRPASWVRSRRSRRCACSAGWRARCSTASCRSTCSAPRSCACGRRGGRGAPTAARCDAARAAQTGPGGHGVRGH